ncbi:MAG: M12 family metallo-peptidase [Candidatus Polarisedimenticolia bacterium]
MKRIFTALTAVFLLFTLSPGVQAVPDSSIHANAPDLPGKAHGVPMGGALRVHGLALDQAGTTDLVLERFEVFAPDATIVVVGGAETPIPNVAYFRGRTSDDPSSMVLLAVPGPGFGKGKTHGVVLRSGGAWMMEKDQSNQTMRTRKVDLERELAGRTFDCDADRMSGANLAAGLDALQQGTGSTELNGIPLPLNVQYTAHYIIDTDYEYWQQFWNIYQPDVNKTAAAALQYLGDLIAYASVVYEREVNTNIVISFARLFATNSDPYSENDDACGCDGTGKLDEVQDVWDGNSTPRTGVHFISGKSEGCGCAYTGVLCSQGSGYAASSQIGTGFNIDDPGFLWEGNVIAHETGHNFNSPHTHNYCGEFSISDPVDTCVDDATDDVSNCLGDNNASLPGLDSLTGGTPGAGNGTIMSYCHFRSGGFTNVPHTFGLYHPYGKAPWRVPAKMLAHVQDNTSCMSLQYTGANLRVTKDCKPDVPMQVGETAICTITIENLGPDNGQGIFAVDDYLSNGSFTFGDITVFKNTTEIDPAPCTTTSNPQDNAGTVSCDIGLLDSGHKATIAIEVSASRPQTINDRVVVTSDSPDPDTTNNVAEDEVNVVELADLSVTKVCDPAQQVAGGTATCEMVVTNNGPSTARGVRLNDTLTTAGPFPYNVTFISTTQGTCSPVPNPVNVSPHNISCNIGTMLPGARVTVEVHVSSVEQISIGDVAAVASTATPPDVPSVDPDVSNNTATSGMSFVAQADLRITKTDDADPVIAGGATFHYNISVTNDGPSKAVNVVVSDQVPAGLQIVSVTSTGGVCNSGLAGVSPTVCNFDTMNAGSSESMTITVKALAGTRGLVNNDCSVSSQTADPDNSDNLDTENTDVVGQADLALVKTRTSGQVVAGAEVDYQVQVTNLGPSTATNVTVVDVLGAWLTYVSSTPACVENPAGTLTCGLGTLQPGEAKVLFLKVKVNPATPDGTLVVNTASVSGSEADPNPANNTDDTSDNVTTRADLWIDKIQNDPSGNPSGTLIYTLTVYNKPGCELDDQLTCWNQSGGPSDAQNVVVTDPLPWTASKLVVQTVSVGCTYNAGTHTVTCNAGTVAFGQTATFEIQAVGKGSLGTMNNTATVTSSTTDPVAGNNSDTVATTIKGGTGRKGGGSL